MRRIYFASIGADHVETPEAQAAEKMIAVKDGGNFRGSENRHSEPSGFGCAQLRPTRLLLQASLQVTPALTRSAPDLDQSAGITT